MTKRLTQDQIQHYRQQGYLVLEGFLSDEWLDRLNQVKSDFIEQSRKVSTSDLVLTSKPIIPTRTLVFAA
jgi:hypothetical protein